MNEYTYCVSDLATFHNHTFFQDAEATDIPLIYEDVTVFLAIILPKSQEYRTVKHVCMLAQLSSLQTSQTQRAEGVLL